MVTRRRHVLPGLLLVASAALGGCGSDDGSSAAADPTAPPSSSSTSPDLESSPPEAAQTAIPAGTPDCDDVWSEGAKLPRTYAGCAADDVFVERNMIECSSGQRIVRHDDFYYAVLGGPIQAAPPSFADNDDYQDVLSSCRA